MRQALKICEANPGDLKPGSVAELACRFGGLASWWFQPLLVERVREELGLHLSMPCLPASHGSCWIVFVQHPPKRRPALRDAFLLPLQWRPNTPHSHRLPPKLVALAQLLFNST